MGSDLTTRYTKLRYPYHKDYGHKTENCKALKQFLKILVAQGHLFEYMKQNGK